MCNAVFPLLSGLFTSAPYCKSVRTVLQHGYLKWYHSYEEKKQDYFRGIKTHLQI
jgi:hypothetical protein